MEQQHTFVNNSITPTGNNAEQPGNSRGFDGKSHFPTAATLNLWPCSIHFISPSPSVLHSSSSPAHLAPRAETIALHSPQLACSPFIVPPSLPPPSRQHSMFHASHWSSFHSRISLLSLSFLVTEEHSPFVSCPFSMDTCTLSSAEERGRLTIKLRRCLIAYLIHVLFSKSFRAP